MAEASVAGDPDYHGVRLSALASPVPELLNVRFVVSPRPLAAAGLSLRLDGPVRVYEQERAPLAGPDLEASSAEVLRYSPGQVVVRVRSRRAGLLVLADSYYPGWVASLDGTPARILVANHALRAVELPAGDHEAEFTFRPGSFRLGLAVSAATRGALALAAALRSRVRGGPGGRAPGAGA